MYALLLSILILDAVLLITVVLLQAGKGGGLAAMGAAGAGSDSLFGSRQAATLLTKATWWTGGIFLSLAFILSLLSSRTATSEPILRQGLQPTRPATTSPALPNSGPAAPAPAGTQGGAAAPATPAPAAPTGGQ